MLAWIKRLTDDMVCCRVQAQADHESDPAGARLEPWMRYPSGLWEVRNGLVLEGVSCTEVWTAAFCIRHGKEQSGACLPSAITRRGVGLEFARARPSLPNPSTIISTATAFAPLWQPSAKSPSPYTISL